MITIPKLIFGIPLPAHGTAAPDCPRPVALERALVEARPGFLLYGGADGTPSPGAFGVESHAFGRCGDYVDLRGLRVTPNLQELEAFEALWQQLGHEMQQLVGSFGLPRLFVVSTPSP